MPQSLPIVAGLAIHLLIGTTTALAAETENAGGTVQQEAGLNRGSRGFAYPVSTANRRFIDQTGRIYLLKTMSSWKAVRQESSICPLAQGLQLPHNRMETRPVAAQSWQENNALSESRLRAETDAHRKIPSIAGTLTHIANLRQGDANLRPVI